MSEFIATTNEITLARAVTLWQPEPAMVRKSLTRVKFGDDEKVGFDGESLTLRFFTSIVTRILACSCNQFAVLSYSYRQER